MTVSILGILFLGGSLSIGLLGFGSLLFSSFAWSSGNGAWLASMLVKMAVLVFGIAGFIGLLLMRTWSLWIIGLYLFVGALLYGFMYVSAMSGGGASGRTAIYFLSAIPDIPSLVLCLVAFMEGLRNRKLMK